MSALSLAALTVIASACVHVCVCLCAHGLYCFCCYLALAHMLLPCAEEAPKNSIELCLLLIIAVLLLLLPFCSQNVLSY